jgi:prepilin-type N-terminal cleavage/methylation domain-containing protein/prepilin-type processing-associated H-X9-DG protein
MSPRKGFTLIELLVVIAIIAILAAILFPVFAQAREKGRAASCLSNLKQIGTATMMYAQDFDEWLPGRGMQTDAGCTALTQNTPWQVQILPYLKNAGVFVCPSASAPITSLGGCAGPFTPGVEKLVPLNSYVSPSGDGIALPNCSPMATLGNSRSGWPLPSVPVPADTIQYADGERTGSAIGRVSLDKDSAATGTPTTGDNWEAWSINEAQSRHTGGRNYVFADGHAKWLKRAAARLWTICDD